MVDKIFEDSKENLTGFQPLFDNILVLLEEEETTLQTTDPTFTENGKVLAVGSDVKTVKIGDVIALFRFGVKTVMRNGNKYHTVRELPAFILGHYNE